MWGSAPGAMPGGLSADSYLEKRVRTLDAEHYSAAGILPFRKASDGSLEFLFALERPWNSFTKDYDALGWNVFGGKRIPREERASEATAVRCFQEAVGKANGAPAGDVMFRLIANSIAVWYALGKFVLLLVEVTDNDLGADFPDHFAEYKKAAGSEDFIMLPSGYKKWTKQIDGVEWVKSADIIGQPKKPLSDLLNNVMQINGVSDFVEGKLDPATLPESQAQPAGQGGQQNWSPPQDYSKGNSKGGGWDNGWQNKGWQGGKNGKGKSDGKGKGWKGGGKGKGGGMGMMQGYGPPPGPPAYAMPQQAFAMAPMPMQPVSYDQSSVEMTRQLYGEQLYLAVLPMAPSPFIAQKITGMLLELPQNELMLNITNQDELRRRVNEALDVLKEDGVF